MARRARFVRPPPRTKMWIGAGVGGTTIVASSDTLISQLNAAALALRPFTILRTHMELMVASDQLAVNERIIASYGQIVVTDSASAVGVTALPSPSPISGNPDGDWFLWQGICTQIDFLSSVGFDPRGGEKYSIDSKAMRKVGADDDIVTVFAMDVAVGAELTAQGRRLIQLH